MTIKKFAALACALAMTTTMLASCGDTDSSSKDDTAASKADTASSAAESVAESAAESTADDSVADDTPAWEPITQFTGFDAFLMYGDKDWLWGNWEGTGYPDASQAFGCDADVTADGEYTVSITKNSIIGTDELPNPQIAVDENTGEALPAEGCVVFCVDITGICNGTKVAGLNDETGEWEWSDAKKEKVKKEGDDANVNKKVKGAYNGDEITVEVTSIKADGEEVTFDPSKIRYGNIEDDNNCYRIEIFNTYGSTNDDPALDPNSLAFASELSVTFKISGLGTVPTFAGAGADAAADSAADAAESATDAADSAAAESTEA